MRVKKIILLGSLVAFMNIKCWSQEFDSGFINLPVYELSPCLLGLLTAVTESNKDNYNKDEFFYSLIFEEGKKYRYINIMPERWLASSYADYAGALKINGMVFLFRGKLDRDSIFKKNLLDQIRVKLQHTKDDISNNSFFNEPSLQGVYHECSGMPIYVEIYTKSKIKDFDMKVFPSGS